MLCQPSYARNAFLGIPGPGNVAHNLGGTQQQPALYIPKVSTVTSHSHWEAARPQVLQLLLCFPFDFSVPWAIVSILN